MRYHVNYEVMIALTYFINLFVNYRPLLTRLVVTIVFHRILDEEKTDDNEQILGLKKAVFVGIVIAACLAIALVIVIIVVVCVSRKKRSRNVTISGKEMEPLHS